MVHTDPATLRRYPILGVLIGGATALLLAYLLLSGWDEARSLIGQEGPQPVSLHEAINLRGTRWITVAEGQWHCERAITVERRAGLDRWVRGSVDASEVPITGAVKGEMLVARFDGPLTCSERAGSRLTGVVGSTEIFTSRGAMRRWDRGAKRVAILNVGASPRYALTMLVALSAIAAGGAVFAGYYLTLMLRSRDRHMAPLPSSSPIEPT